MIDKPPAFVSGTRVGDGGRYEIRQRIGVGGMAEVYKAVDTRLGNRIVAIKALLASVATHPFAEKMRGLFIQEAQALSRVKDENVVDVLDFGTAADGTPYMVMEFLHGTDLGVALQQRKQMSVEDAVDVMLGVCAGVHACHLAGIIHRDLKPANIFLSRTLKGEQPKVLDFSVAKVPIARSPEEADQAKTDLIVGTPSYMSPEQAVGKPANELSDQYAIGALLYRCLTGRPPQGVLPRPREVRSEIPDGLEEAILRALEPAPETRFPTVHDLGQALLAFGSAAGRGRWKSYYGTAPRPIDPTVTGPLPEDLMRLAQAAQASVATIPPATVVAPPYDPKIHERTTRVEPGAKAASGIEPSWAKTTVVDSAAGAGAHSIVDSAAATTIDAPATRPPSTASMVAPAAKNHRRLIVVVAVLGAFVVTATVAGVQVRRNHRTGDVAPRAPEWTRASAVPSPALAEPPPLPSAEKSSPALAADKQEPERMLGGESSQPPAAAQKPKRHRHVSPSSGDVQYLPDGLPVLH
jgi:eukaryotic-like serine/threonine-protein kinase